MNDPKFYILTFDARGVSLPALTRYLQDSNAIVGYWNYIPLVYCVKSYHDCHDLAVKISAFMGDSNFVLMEINKNNIDGRLPQRAWEWFYQESSPPTGLGSLAAALSSTQLGSILGARAPQNRT